MKTYSLNDALFDESGQRWVPAPVAQGLYEALKELQNTTCIRGIRGYSHVPSMRDQQDAMNKARKALAAADKEYA